MSNVVRIDPGPRMSEASVFGDRMYLSGMIPEDTSLDITGQVKQALAEIDALLKKGGSDKTKILSAVIWLARHRRFRRHERGMGRLGRARPDAGPRHGAGPSERPEDEGRDHGRGGDLMYRTTVSPDRAASGCSSRLHERAGGRGPEERGRLP